MESQGRISAPDRSANRLTVLVGASLVAVVVAACAGILLLIIDPADGSTTEAVLGITAAVAGISTGILVIAAFIYAQVKNLWGVAPLKVRAVLWAFIAVGIAITVWNLVSQPFSD